MAVTLGAVWIKDSLSPLDMCWNAGSEWSRERRAAGARLGATVLSQDQGKVGLMGRGAL